MVKASCGGLSYTTALSGVCPAVEMGNYCHREATLFLPPVVFMLSKASPPRKRVAESGRALGRPTDSTTGGRGVLCACKLEIWQAKLCGAQCGAVGQLRAGAGQCGAALSREDNVTRGSLVHSSRSTAKKWAIHMCPGIGNQSQQCRVHWTRALYACLAYGSTYCAFHLGIWSLGLANARWNAECCSHWSQQGESQGGRDVAAKAFVVCARSRPARGYGGGSCWAAWCVCNTASLAQNWYLRPLQGLQTPATCLTSWVTCWNLCHEAVVCML